MDDLEGDTRHQGNPAKGSNTIRVTATTSSGGPNLDSMTTTGEGTGGGGGSVTGLTFRSFHKLTKDTLTPFNNVTAKHIIFDASHGSHGHNDVNKNDPRFVEVTGAKVVGYGGGWDKYTFFFEVTSRDVEIRTHAGSRAVFLSTSRTLAFWDTTGTEGRPHR